MSKSRNPPILLVDDGDDIRTSLTELLELEGFSVSTAANGREALKVLETAPRPGVILLDLMMPVMNGAEFMAEQRRNWRISDIPVIILTANSYRSEAVMVGVADVLLKPIQPDALFIAIRRVVK